VIGIIATVISATALSWHGVLLAEAARAAPEGSRGGVTGGVLSFGQIGALTAPIYFCLTARHVPIVMAWALLFAQFPHYWWRWYCSVNVKALTLGK
jgi:hypothetical protein